MHKFLRAIGFSNLKKEELQNIFDQIMKHPTVEKTAMDSEGNEFTEISKEFGDFFGISLRGTYQDFLSFSGFFFLLSDSSFFPMILLSF